MNFLSFVKKDNGGGDVGMLGMILIMVVLTVMVMGVDMFANMLSKEYVISKMQAAQSYALVKNYDEELSDLRHVVYGSEYRIKSDYEDYIEHYVNVGNTVFNSVNFWGTYIKATASSYSIESRVTYEPHQFIRNPREALFGVDVKKARITTSVRTVLTNYDV